MHHDRTVDWIAEREFATVDTDAPVILRLGRPRQNTTGEWACAVCITQDGTPRITDAFGEDAMQALLLGIVMARAQLASVQATRGLTWFGETDLGFDWPVPA